MYAEKISFQENRQFFSPKNVSTSPKIMILALTPWYVYGTLGGSCYNVENLLRYA
jgi:hypothetical protein